MGNAGLLYHGDFRLGDGGMGRGHRTTWNLPHGGSISNTQLMI